MAEEADGKERSRKLLSNDAVPRVAIPRSRRGPKREFKLPDEISAPIPRRASKVADDDGATDEGPPKRRRRGSTGRFKERTLGWFKTGEELEGKDSVDPLETGEAVRDDGGGSFMFAAVLGGVGVAVVVLVILWLS
jgi:hypothetical protein